MTPFSLRRAIAAKRCFAGVRYSVMPQSRSHRRFARHGRERAPRRGSAPGLAFRSAGSAITGWETAAFRHRSSDRHPATVGALPLHPDGRGDHGFDAALSGETGVQGQRPCVGGVVASARASERCSLPAFVSAEIDDRAGRVLERDRGDCPRPCQAILAMGVPRPGRFGRPCWCEASLCPPSRIPISHPPVGRSGSDIRPRIYIRASRRAVRKLNFEPHPCG